MAENRVPYIIDLTVSDKDLRTRMSKLNWEDILGSKGKSFKKVLTQDTEAAANEIRTTLGGLGLDWGKILGEKDLELLEKKIAKVITANTEKLKVFGRSGDTSGIQNTIDLVSALGNELKSLGSSFDAPSIARNMGAFMKVLTPLSARIEQLAKEPEKVTAAFDRLFNNTAKNVQSVDLGKSFDISGKIKVAMQGLKATNEEIKEATENLEKYKNVVARLSGDHPATIKLAKDIDGLNQQLDEQMKKEEELAAKGKTNNAQYAATLKNIMAIENARLKMKAKPTQNYLGESISQDFGYYEEQINKVIERFSRKIVELESKLGTVVDKSFAEVIAKQISDIKLSVSLSEQEQSKFVNEINAFVKNVNRQPLETVKIGVDRALDDAANLIEDKEKRAYGANEADDDANTTKIVEQTEKRFDRIATSIQGKQNQILENTKEWRSKMLEQFKFKSSDFEFKFNETLVQELQTLFDDYLLEVHINPETLANEIKTVLSDSNISFGGGTTSVDPVAMANVVASGLRAILTGDFTQLPVSDTDAESDISDSIEHTATEIEESAKHLDLAEDYVKDVVAKLKAVAKYAMKDSNGSIATRRQFDSLGIDLQKVKIAGDVGNDAKIVSMLENALLQRDEFGDLTGSTLISDLSNFKGSSSKTIPAFLSSINEVFFMLQEDTQTTEEWTRKRQGKEIFDSARAKALAASELRNVRSPIRQGNIPSMQSIENAISLMSAIGRNTDDLDALKTAREALGDKTDDASIEAFKTAADLFYKSSTKVFYDLKQQAEDTFKGTVYLEGRNKGKIRKTSIDNYKDLAKIKDDAVIVDVEVHSSLNNVALGEVKSKYSNRSSAREETRLMRGAKADYLTQRKYEEDILNKQLSYSGFKAQGASDVSVDLGKSFETNQKRKEALLAEIKIKEAEKSSLDAEIATLDKKIEELTQKNKTISDSRRKAATEKVADYELTKKQLEHEILLLEERVGNEKTGEEAKIGSLSKDIEESLRKRSFAEKQLAELSEEDVERKKKSFNAKILELEAESPDLQKNLTQAQARQSIAESERIMAQADVFKAESALKSIPNTKKNEAARAEAENAVKKAKFALSDAVSKVNETAKDVEYAISEIERNAKQISNLKGQISTTTLDSIREEQLNRIRAIDNTIKSLENEFESLLTQKHAKDATLIKINKELDKARNVVPLRTQRELDSALSDKQALENQKKVADATIENNKNEVDRLFTMNKRIQAEHKYNELQEKSLMLQGSIKKMEEDGATEKALKKKRTELEKVNTELSEAKEKVQSLGGFLGQQDTREYSDNEKKTYALEQLRAIEDDLITAKAQQRVVASRISKKDSEIAELDKWGVGAGIGASALNSTKRDLTSQFMSSDYVKSLEDALKEKVHAALNESENKSREIFDKKVTTSMERLGWNPLDQIQVKKFLDTKQGKQLSSDFAAEVDSNKKYIWEQYDEYIQDLHTKLRTEFKESLKSDKGVVSAKFKTQDETGKWIDEIVEVRVKETLKARLENEKNILEAQQKPINDSVDRLEADKKTAIEYGGVSDKELLSAEIIEDQIRKEEILARKKVDLVNAQAKLNELEDASVSHKDESYKSAKKEVTELEKQIARYEMLVRDRQKLVQMRYDETKENTYTDEEKELHFTNQLVNYNQKIEDSLTIQNDLRKKIKESSGDEKTKLQYRLQKEEENVTKWSQSAFKYEAKLDRLKTSEAKSKPTSILPDGGVFGGIASLISESLSGANLNIDTTELAKEITLDAILKLLQGETTQVVDTKDYEQKMARIAELEAKNTDSNKTRKSKRLPSDVKDGADALYKTWDVKPSELEFDTVKKRAIELKQVIDTLYDEGKTDTQEFINAQTELSKLLSGWRNTIGRQTKTNPEVYGKKGKENWESYLTSNIFDNLNNVPLSRISGDDYLSRIRKNYKGAQDTSVADSAAKSNLTKKERKELKRLKEEVASYSTTSSNKNSSQQSMNGIATENTLREILSALKDGTIKIGSVGYDSSGQKPKDAIPYEKISDKTSDTTISSTISKINKYAETIKSAKLDGYLMEDDSNAVKFDEAISDINKMVDAIAKGTPLTEEMKADFEQLYRRAVDIGDAVNKTINQNKNMYSGINEIKSVNKQRDDIIGTFGQDRFVNSNVALVKEYNDAYVALHKTYKDFAENRTLYDTKNQEQLRRQAVGVRNLGTKLKASIAQANDLYQKVDQSSFYFNKQTGKDEQLGGIRSLTTEEASAKNLEAVMRRYVQEDLKQGNIENVKFNNSTKQLTYTFRINKDTVADMVVQYNAAENALFAYNKQERESLTGWPAFVQGMKSKLKSITQYMFSITSITRVWGEVKKGVQYIKEIDSALTELKKVTDETEASYEKFLNTAAKTADRVGSTIKEIVSSTADWSRLGYTMEDATNLAESTAVLLNVSEFSSIEDATSALTSTLQAFSYTATQSMDVVDVLNEVGKLVARR